MRKTFKKKSMTVCILLLVVMAIHTTGCGKEKEYVETKEDRMEIRESGDLYIYLGEVTENLSPLKRDSIAGENLWSLCFSNLYQDSREVFDRSVLSKFQESDTAFHYFIEEKKEENKTYLTISVNPSLRSSFGTALTAEDIIFNYSIRTDPSLCMAGFQSGDQKFDGRLISGGEAYYYGTNQITERKKEIAESLNHPDQELAAVLRDQIILPELRKEYQWVEELFSTDQGKNLTKGYQNPGEMFVHFYAYQTNYSGKNRSKEEILSEIASQYGGNYHALERVTGRSYGKKAEDYALCVLLKKQGKDSVKEITGLKKISEKEVQIVFNGQNLSPENIMDMWILPYQSYGNDSGDDRTGLDTVKGDAAAAYEKTRKIFVGSGSYYCTDFSTTKLCFRRNRHYYAGYGEVEKLYILKNQKYKIKELVGKLLNREIDLAVTQTGEELQKMLENRETGAIYKLNLFPVGSEEAWGIIYRTDYVNRTSFPEKAESLSEMFKKLYTVKVNR